MATVRATTGDAGAHHWARELAALGHEVRLMPPSYVKPYVKRGKTDQADAEARLGKRSPGRPCASRRRRASGTTPVKSAERQAALVNHKTREFLVRQQTQTVNAIRAHLAEFGIVVPKGIQNVDRLQAAAGNVPEAARSVLELLAAQLRDTCARIVDVTKRIEAAQAEDALAPRLATLPGIGALTASALAATTPEVDAFRSARDYAAWLGLKPKPQSTGGKERLGVRSGRSPSPIGPGPMAPRWTTVRGLTDELRDRLEVEAVQALGGRE